MGELVTLLFVLLMTSHFGLSNLALLSLGDAAVSGIYDVVQDRALNGHHHGRS